MARRPGGRRRRKVCFFTSNNITHIDYKDVELLKIAQTLRFGAW